MACHHRRPHQTRPQEGGLLRQTTALETRLELHPIVEFDVLADQGSPTQLCHK